MSSVRRVFKLSRPGRWALGAVLALTALLLVYWVGVRFLGPLLVERYLPSYLERFGGVVVSAQDVRIDPFRLTLEVDHATIKDVGGERLGEVDHALVDLSLRSFVQRAWVLDRVGIAGVQLQVVRRPSGEWNIGELLRRFEGRERRPTRASAGRLLVNRFSLQGGRLVIRDLTETPAARTEVGPIHLAAVDVATFGDGGGNFSLSARLPQGGSFEASGAVSLATSALSGSVRLADFNAVSAWPFVEGQLPLGRLQAKVTASATFRVHGGASPVVVADGLSFDIAPLSIAGPDGQKPMLEVDRVTGSGGRFDSRQRAFVMQQLALHGGHLRVHVSEDGLSNWQRFVSTRTEPEGRAGKRPSDGAWRVSLASVRAAGLALQYDDRSRSTPLKVDIDAVSGSARLDVELARPARAALSDGQLQMRLIQVSGAGAEQLFSLESARIEGVRADSSKRSVRASALRLAGGRVAVVRQPDGSVAPLSAFTAVSRESAGTETATEPEWSYSADTFAVEDVAVTLEDRTFKPSLSLATVVESATLGSASSEAAGEMPFEASIRVEQGGTVDARGTIRRDARSVDARVEVEQLSLLPLQPALSRLAAVRVESGTLSATSDIRFDGESAAFEVSGSASLAQLKLSAAGSADPVIAINRLTAQAVSWKSKENQLLINQLTAVEPYLKIVVSKDRKVNLAELWSPRAKASSTGTRPESAQASTLRPLNTTIGVIRLRRGAIDFADHSLALPFAARVTSVGGAIEGVSSNPSRHAQVRAGGTVERYASASVEGSLEVFNPARHLDLTVSFDNVSMPLLSPYTATFAGRRIEAGTLWLTLKYEIDKGVLDGSNAIRITNFSLGERVEGGKALGVPLDLVVAMLKDANGRISLSVPVEGNLKNPRFSVAAAIRAGLRNVFSRAAAAPFDALAEMFGYSGDKPLGAVDFEAGSARIRPEARQKLDFLARALSERPQLRLQVIGPYDADLDSQALRRHQLERDLAAALGRPVAASAEPGPINIDSPETRRRIESMLSERVGRSAVEQLTRLHAGDTSAAYEDMLERLLASYPLPDGAVQVLAARRSKAIAEYLARAGEVAGDRISAGRVRAVEATERDLVRAQLQVAGGASS